MAEKLTHEQIQAKADELSKAFNVNVNPVVFEEENSDDQVVGYIKEPGMPTKIRMMDKSIMGAFSSASEVLEACLIPDGSDPRILAGKDKPEYHKYYMGAVMEIYNTVKYSTNTFKKK